MLSFVGLLGFIGGFLIGQMILFIILKNRSKDELLDNKKLHWIYGTLNWAIAFGSMALCIFAFKHWVTAG